MFIAEFHSSVSRADVIWTVRTSSAQNGEQWQ